MIDKLLLVFCFLGTVCQSMQAAGQDKKESGKGTYKEAMPPHSTWVKKQQGNSNYLIISLLRSLSSKQKTTLASGFETFSHLELRLSGSEEPFATRSCSVKFDLWEEAYLVQMHHKREQGAKLDKSIHDYAQRCLSVSIENKKVLSALKNGGVINATLQIEQISIEQAQKIKEWLVEQQSAVMQGLFSHMLGELTLHKTSKIPLRIPAL